VFEVKNVPFNFNLFANLRLNILQLQFVSIKTRTRFVDVLMREKKFIFFIKSYPLLLFAANKRKTSLFQELPS